MSHESMTSTAEIDYEELGQEIYVQAQREVAARRGTIAEVESEVQSSIHNVFQGNTFLDTDQIEVSAMQFVHEDLDAVHGDIHVGLFSDDPSLRGYYNGDKNVYMNIEGGLDESTYIHENDHRENEFIAGIGLDEHIAEPVMEELSATAKQHVDEEDVLLTFTQRQGSEESATAAAGESTAAYDRDFVKPTQEVIDRMQEAQINGRSVVDRLIEGHDVEQFRKAVRDTLEYEAAQKTMAA